MMKKEDPKLTALVLGELSGEEEIALRKILREDGALRREVEELERTADAVGEALGGGYRLGARRMAELRRAGRRSDAEKVLQTVVKRGRGPVWIGAAAAVAVAAGVIFLQPFSKRGPVAGGGEKVPVAARHGDGRAVEDLERILVGEGRLPSAGELDFDRLVSFPRYDLVDGKEVGGVVALAETGPCPWREDRRLLVFWMKSDELRTVDAEVVFSADQVGEWGRIGSDEGRRLTGGLQGLRCLVFEFEPKKSQGEPASIQLIVGQPGAEADEAYLAGFPDAETWDEASASFRIAATIAGFSEGDVKRSAERAEQLEDASADRRTRYLLDLIAVGGELARNEKAETE